jgi:hypothetical protein
MNTKKIYGLTAAFTLSLILHGAAFVQQASSTPLDFSVSPTKSSTAGLFTGAADDYLDVNAYNSVEFNSFFSYGSLASMVVGQFGFAKRIGAVYVGAGYVGSMGRGWERVDLTECEIDVSGLGLGRWKKLNEADAINGDIGAVLPLNGNNERFAVLIGVADMGFKIGFAADRKSFEAEDVYFGTYDKNLVYSSYSARHGWLIPSVGWGMARGLTENGIRPSVNLTVGFYSEESKGALYFDLEVDDEKDIEMMFVSQNYCEPILEIALGGYDFYRGNSVRFGVDAEYTLCMKIYKNIYNLPDGNGGLAFGVVDGVYEGTTIIKSDSSVHVLKPSVKLDCAFSDAVQLRAKAAFPVMFASQTNTGMDVDIADGCALKKHGVDFEMSAFSIAPVIDAALQYKILDNKLVFNMGVSFIAATITAATETTNNYVYGEEIPHQKRIKKIKQRSTNSPESLRCGVIWNINENIGVEAVTGVTAAEFDLMGSPSSLTHFTRFLAALKF